MRRADPGTALTPGEEAAAAAGQKGMVSFGRPFLDFVLSGLADAGIRRVCLVLGPEHHSVREYYTGSGRPSRVTVEFAVQPEPRGTADAVLAAEPVAAGGSFLTLNADNLYPVAALAALAALPRAGLAGFRRSTLLAGGLIPAERILAFALIEVSPDGCLTRIVEKPDPAAAALFGNDPLVSMNAWLLPPTIFGSCRAIAPSPRGELELQDAVTHSIRVLGERYRLLEQPGPVLDLSSRADIPRVRRRLAGLEARP